MKLFHFIFLVTFSINSFSQGYRSTSKDSIVLSFMNSKEVMENEFKHFNKLDTGIFIILDPDKLLVNLNITDWFGHPVQIINKGTLIDSFKIFDAHYLFKDRKNYFIVRQLKLKNSVTLVIHHPYDNLFNSAEIKRKNNMYFIEQIESGVI
jgi:hypothetical protein